MDDKPLLLHMFTPGAHMSPFDVNMAYDAGWDAAIPYEGVALEETADMVQDTIFSRGPAAVRRTGIFLGGRDTYLAMDMLEAARQAMVPPFEISVMADPAGGFTTAAALVALVEKRLGEAHGVTLQGQEVYIFGGTGPVGVASGVLAAEAGARVKLVSHESPEKARREAEHCNRRWGGDLDGVAARDAQQRRALLEQADVVLATAKAGVQVLEAELVRAAPRLKVAADVNAVPPAGIEGVGVKDDGVAYPGSVSGAVGIGALAVGNIKYGTQHALLKRLYSTEQAERIGFQEAFEVAREQTR